MSISSSVYTNLCTAIRAGDLSHSNIDLKNYDVSRYWNTADLVSDIRVALECEADMQASGFLSTTADEIAAYDEAGQDVFSHLGTLPFANCETLEECATIAGDAAMSAINESVVNSIMESIETELDDLGPVEFNEKTFEPSVFNFVDYEDFADLASFKDDHNVHYHHVDGKIFSIIELDKNVSIKIDYVEKEEDGE